MSECCPFVTCRLVDRFGNTIDPYAPGSVVYAAPRSLGRKNRWSVAIEGYIAVYSGQERISPPFPFCMITSFFLCVPPKSDLVFRLESFHAWAVEFQHERNTESDRMKLMISIKTAAFSQRFASFLVPQVDSDLHRVSRVCISAEQIYDSTVICSNRCMNYKNAQFRAEIYQYTAIADGIKRTFNDRDEMKQYGCRGILSPNDVSYFNVFVNGLLQPPKNYVLKEGELTFTTGDVPSKGQTVIILFVTWKDFDDRMMNTVEWQYSAVSNGYQKIYTNEDELPEYRNKGIPSPCAVSYFNLYVNGVLQPQVNYRVKRGVLELTTSDAPSKGALVILESVVIRDSKERLFRVQTSAYNAYSNGGKIYTNQDKIRIYGRNGIPDPDQSSYQNLFINSVLQPSANYFVRKGYLILETEDGPVETAPITLQSVGSDPAASCCKTQYSKAAFAELKKEFSNCEN